jgi:hypothetical protein
MISIQKPFWFHGCGDFFRDIPGTEWASFNKDILGQTCICEANQKKSQKDLHYNDTTTREMTKRRRIQCESGVLTRKQKNFNIFFFPGFLAELMQ